MRLADIAAEYGDQIRTVWLSFLLRPEPEPRPVDKFTEYTAKWATPGSLEPRARFNSWSGVNAPPSHSFPSALAGKVAATFGGPARDAFSLRLFEAYFTENRTISDRDVLLDVAAEAGLDRAEFDHRWRHDEDDLLQQVWGEYRLATQSGIQGVPAVVVNRRMVVSGAVEVDAYRDAIAQVLAAGPEGDDGATGGDGEK